MGSKMDKTAGAINEAVGHARHKTGEAIGSDKMVVKGLAQEAKGEAQQGVGHIKGMVKDGAEAASKAANRGL